MLSWGRQPGLCVCGVCVHQRHIDSNAVWHENPAGFTAVTTQTSHLSLKCLIANLDWVFDAFSIIHPHLYGKYTTRDRLQLIFIPRHSSMFLGVLRFTVTYSTLTYWSPHIDHQEIQAVFEKPAKALSREVVAGLLVRSQLCQPAEFGLHHIWTVCVLTWFCVLHLLFYLCKQHFYWLTSFWH